MNGTGIQQAVVIGTGAVANAVCAVPADVPRHSPRRDAQRPADGRLPQPVRLRHRDATVCL